MERPLVLVPLHLALLRHLVRAARQGPLEPLPRVLQVRLGPRRLGLRTFPMTIRGSLTNLRPSTAKGASPSSSGNAAIVAGIPYGVAGVLGAVVAAVFV
jgi:hypothetical protein